MPHVRRIETGLAAWSLVGGLLANFAGLMLMSRLPWQLSVALVALGTSGLIGAVLLLAAADRNHKTKNVAPPRPSATPH